MAEACVLSLTLHFTHSLSRLPPSRRPLRVRIPPPALGRTVNAARIPASFSFLEGCGNDGRDYLLSWRPAVRLISINLISINQGQGRNR